MTVEIDTIMTLPSNMQEIFGMIRAAADKFFQKIPVEIRLFAAERELDVDTPKQVDEVMRQWTQTLEEQATASNAAEQASSALDNELLKVKSTLDSLKDVTTGEAFGEILASIWQKGFGRTGREALDKTAQFRDFDTVVKDIQAGLKDGFEVEQIQVLTRQLKNLSERGLHSASAMTALNDSIIKIQGLQGIIDEGIGAGQQELETSKKLAEAGDFQREYLISVIEAKLAQHEVGATIDANKSKTDVAVQSQKALTQATKEGAQVVAEQPTKVQQADQATTQLQGTQATVTTEVDNTNSGIQQMTSQYLAAEQAALRVASATRTINEATGALTIRNPGVEFNAKGGQVGYFANGGRGTDTIPAMLSAGEHVTNARSSQRFFSQLQAMNAGQQPVFRNDGGDTYNTNVGDINVSGASGPEVTARTIMQRIRREERRGSGR